MNTKRIYSKRKELQQNFTPFKRTKVINGHEYIYEITLYRDPITKKIKQKSKYLGKQNNSNEVVKVREKLPTLKHVVSYGDSYLFNALVSELGIDKILKQCFTEEETNWILLLTGYKLLHNGSLERLSSFMETSDLFSYYPVSTCMSSQQASRILERLGEDNSESIPHFYYKWIQHHPIKGDNLLFDLTSFSSKSKQIELLENGYNKDHLPIPQVNLGLLVNENLKLPLYYKLYPGSIKDMTTIDNMMEDLRCLNIKDITLIMDRGFYSKANLLSLIDHKHDFILPIPLTSKSLYEEIVNKSSSVLNQSPSDLIHIEERQYYAVKGSITLNSEDEEILNDDEETIQSTISLHSSEPVILNYVLSLDPVKREEERFEFFKRLNEAEIILKQVNWNKYIQPNETLTLLKTKKQIKEFNDKLKQVMKNKVGSCSKYFKLDIEPDGTPILNKRNDIIENHTRLFGLMILLSSKPIVIESVLRRYRSRDLVESMFDSVKNELSGLPIRAHKTNTMKGQFFIIFIAMIIQFYLLDKMKKGDINRKYSISDIFFELQKLKKTIWYGKDKIINEITKTQQLLLEALQIFLPKVMRS